MALTGKGFTREEADAALSGRKRLEMTPEQRRKYLAALQESSARLQEDWEKRMGWKDLGIPVKAWIGRRIVSQYGLVCDVLDAVDGTDGVLLKCRALHNGRVWDWRLPFDPVSLVTAGGEVLDMGGEVYGRVDGQRLTLYPDEECRTISADAVLKEFDIGEGQLPLPLKEGDDDGEAISTVRGDDC